MSVDAAVADALARAVADGSWARYDGGHVAALETRLAAMHGVAHAVSCASGTLAVEVALRALGVEPGDEVVLAAYDYPGNFLSVHAAGGRPVLVDVRRDNAALDADRLESALSDGVKAVIVSHLHGSLADMTRIVALCRSRGVGVVEDAAQCPMATVQGRAAGTHGDIGVISFGGSKLLTAGRGGALLTDRADLRQRARLLLGRGPNLVSPLSELQAIVLMPQLDALAERNRQRARAVEHLRQELSELRGLTLFNNEVEGSPCYYKVGMVFDATIFGESRDAVTKRARAAGVPLDAGFRAIHVGRGGGRFRAAGELTNAGRLHDCCVVLHHAALQSGTTGLVEALASS